MLEIEARPAAISDLIDAAQNIELTAGPYIAERFLRMAQECIRELSIMPESGPLRTRRAYLELRTWQIHPYPHLILYSPTDTTLEILRVLHAASDIEAIVDAPANVV
jgi:toxin ParE1/3/4